jgi:hypothetical protein
MQSMCVCTVMSGALFPYLTTTKAQLWKPSMGTSVESAVATWVAPSCCWLLSRCVAACVRCHIDYTHLLLMSHASS